MNNRTFVAQLTEIVGSQNILVNERDTEYYRKGFRSGEGSALAVVFPVTLIQQWNILKACVSNNKIVIMQAANTGLTAGSTPNGNDYDRDIIVLNTTKMDKIYLLNQGKQIISFPGATLFTLEKKLKPLSREPHSVIGSSCIGASIIGGIANNSGGALVKRGPAYTELSIFAQINAAGELELVNHLGVNLGKTPEDVLQNLEQHNFHEKDIDYGETQPRKASATDYEGILRDVDANTPARYNADTRRLFEASGCAGKLAVFAVRLDTYPAAEQKQTFYIGTNDHQQLTQLRREILSQFKHLPEVAEYMHKDIYDIAEKYGKDTFAMINWFGTEPLPKLFAIKGACTAYFNKLSFLPKNLPDKCLQYFSRLLPNLLPKRIQEFRRQYEHYLILETSNEGINEATQFLKQFFENSSSGSFFQCSEAEAKKAYLHRFAAAGAPLRYEIIHENETEGVLALDIALRRNDKNWFEQLPDHISQQLSHSLYYGHFLCHVMHQDYLVKKGANITQIKTAMLDILSDRGAKYPAEHNVGHVYEAEDTLKSFYNDLDPTNTFNPGIGKTSKNKCSCHHINH